MRGEFLHRIWRRIRSGRPPKPGRGLILMYHRICNDRLDPWGISVTPHHFEEQLEILKHRAHVVPLTQLAGRAASGNLRTHSVAITFDDGYADSAEQALPRLERFDLPASFFIPTCALDATDEFWWDELEQIFLEPQKLPPDLELTITGELVRLSFRDVDLVRKFDSEGWDRWRYWDPPPTSRHAAYLDIWQRLYGLPDEDKRRILDTLHRWAGTATRIRPSRRTVTPAVVRRMAQSGLVEIGAHTVTHQALGRLDSAGQRSEILPNKKTLEDLIERPVTSFSYPHGDYDDSSIQLLREAGFSRACTTAGNTVAGTHDPLLLPRVHALDWDGEALASQLRSILNVHL